MTHLGLGQCVLGAIATLAMLAGCGGSQPLISALGAVPQSNTVVAERSGRPKIWHISRILAEQTQTITIDGANFGTYQPYDGDSKFLKMTDVGRTMHHYEWAAGCEGPAPCGTTLNVTSWTDNQIVIAGFTGTYYDNPLKHDDFLLWWVVNPQTRRGPGVRLAQVRR